MQNKLSLEIEPQVEFLKVTYPGDSQIDGNKDCDHYVRPLWKMFDPTTFIDKPSHPPTKINGVTWFKCNEEDFNDPYRAFYLESRAKTEDSYRRGYRNAQIDCAINTITDPLLKDQINSLRY